MPTSLGPAEILVILVVALIVLGPKRLPEAGRQVGKALAEVRRWANDMKSEVQGALDVDVPMASTVVEPVVVSGTATSVASHDEPSSTEVVQPVTVAVDQPPSPSTQGLATQIRTRRGWPPRASPAGIPVLRWTTCRRPRPAIPPARRRIPSPSSRTTRSRTSATPASASRSSPTSPSSAAG